MAIEPTPEQLAYLRDLTPAVKEAQLGIERAKRAFGADPAFAEMLREAEDQLQQADALRQSVLKEYGGTTRRTRA
jgi:hypothetical protein